MAFESNKIIADLNDRAAEVVIARPPRRTSPPQIDTAMYKGRHLIQIFFCKLKEFKYIAQQIVEPHLREGYQAIVIAAWDAGNRLIADPARITSVGTRQSDNITRR